MTRPFESDFVTTTNQPLVVLTAPELVGLLRRVAGGLARLEQLPRYPGMSGTVAAAAHAVHRALVELESIG